VPINSPSPIYQVNSQIGRRSGGKMRTLDYAANQNEREKDKRNDRENDVEQEKESQRDTEGRNEKKDSGSLSNRPVVKVIKGARPATLKVSQNKFAPNEPSPRIEIVPRLNVNVERKQEEKVSDFGGKDLENKLQCELIRVKRELKKKEQTIEKLKNDNYSNEKELQMQLKANMELKQENEGKASKLKKDNSQLKQENSELSERITSMQNSHKKVFHFIIIHLLILVS
jgi:hypothetical protein